MFQSLNGHLEVIVLMTNVEHISVLRPSYWDYSKLVTSNRPTYQIRKEEKIAHFVSSFISKNLYQKTQFNTPMNLNAEVLKGLYGKDYKKDIIDPLVKCGYLRVNDRYSAGNFSKSYNLKLTGYTPTTEVKLVDSLFIHKVRTIAKRRTQYILKHYPESQAVYHTLLHTTIDYNACLQHLNTKFNTKFFKTLYLHLLGRFGKANTKELLRLCYKSNTIKGESKKAIRSQIKRRFELDQTDLNNMLDYAKSFATYKSYIWHLKNWKQLSEADIHSKPDFIFFTSDKSKRLYHNATSTPKEIRRFLKVDGNPLVEIDASNSQWFLLVALLKKHKEEKVQHILYNHTREQITRGTGGETTQPEQQPKPLHLMLNPFSKELHKLEAYLEQGYFRKAMTEAFSKEVGRSVEEGEVKGLLIKRILFEDPSKGYLNNEPIVKVFKSIFPTLYKAITELKKGGLDYQSYGYLPKDSYKALAVELQKMESSIFIRSVHKRLEGVLRLSIHDALLVQEKDAKQVLNALQVTAKDKWAINLKATLSRLEK